MNKDKKPCRTERILMRAIIISALIGLMIIALAANDRFGNEENKDIILALVYCICGLLTACYIAYKVRAEKQRNAERARKAAEDKELNEEIEGLLSEIPDKNK